MTELITFTCPTCKANLEITLAANRFTCQNCGNEYTVRKQGSVTVFEPVNIIFICPIGKHEDMIQKVSAIVSEQTFDVTVMRHESYAYKDQEGRIQTETRIIPREGIQQSHLAQKLLPPKEPKKSPFFFLLIPYAIVAFYTIAPPAVWTILGSYNLVAEYNYPIFAGILTGIFGTAVVIGIVIFWLFMLKKLPRAKQKHEQDYKIRHSKWLQAIGKWKSSYYCHRHDVVFVAGDTETVSPNDFQAFVYR